MSNVELEAKVVDLEKRIEFLYKSLDEQVYINQKCIDLIRDLRGTTDKLYAIIGDYADTTILILTHLTRNMD